MRSIQKLWRIRDRDDKLRIVVSTEAEYENKTADIEFTFDEEQQMDSLTINAHYSTAEILKKRD